MLNCFTLNFIKISLVVFNAQFKLINHNFGKRRNNLGGGGKYENKRYVTTSACEAHSCPKKAFVFFDTKEKFVIGLIKNWDNEYYIFSKTQTAYQVSKLGSSKVNHLYFFFTLFVFT